MMKELLERLRAPMNRFWLRMRNLLLTLAAVLQMLGEFVLPMLNDGYVPEEYKPVLRAIYVAGYFGAFLAMLTKADPMDDK